MFTLSNVSTSWLDWPKPLSNNHNTMFSGKENQSQGEGSQVNGLQTEELTQLREEVEEFRKQNALLQTQLGDKDALINTLVSKCEFRPVKHAKSILDMTIGTIEILLCFSAQQLICVFAL